MWTKNILKTRLFEDDVAPIIVESAERVFLKHMQIQNYGWLLRFKFLWCSVDKEHLMRFQSKTSVFIFLWRDKVVHSQIREDTETDIFFYSRKVKIKEYCQTSNQS